MSNVSLLYLLETCRTDRTKENYITRLKKFQNHIGMELDDFIVLDHKTIEKMIIEFILTVKREHNPNSVPTYLSPVKSYLEMNDIILNWKKLFRFFPTKIKLSGQSAWTTEDIQKMLSVSKKISTIAIIHVLASTGCRIGGISELKIKDIVDVEHGCKMIKVYAGDKEEYTTFLTPEASFAYEQHIKFRRDGGENITPDSYVFATRKDHKKINRHSLYMIMKYVVENANVRGIMLSGDLKGGRYKTQLMHGFRKRFNTVMKLNSNVNDNAIEKMLGHKNGLDGTYLQITDEVLLEHFMKGIIDLTESDDHRLRLEKIELEHDKEAMEDRYEIRLRALERKTTAVHNTGWSDDG